MVKYPKFIRDLIIEHSKNEIINFNDPLVIDGVEHRFIIGYNLSLDTEQENILIVMMMNPSKANQSESDSTINRLLKYAKVHEYTKLIVLNSLSVYLTRSSELRNEMILEEQFDENIDTIRNSVCNECDIIFATGNPVIRKGAESLAEIYKILRNENIEVKRFNTSLTNMGYTKHLRTTSNIEMKKDLVELII